MKFQIGDKVSFINEKQDGVIVKIISDKLVSVAIEDGFEITVSASELVKTIHHSLQKQPAEPENKFVENTSEIPDPRILVENNTIAFTVLPEKAVLTGDVAFYIVNKTDHFLHCTVYLSSGNKYKSIFSGDIPANAFEKIYSSGRSGLTDVDHFRINGLLYNTSEKPGDDFFRKDVEVMLPDINNSHPAAKGFNAFAKTRMLFNANPLLENPEILKDLVDKYSGKTGEIKKRENVKPAISLKQGYGIIENEKDVDLHIEELTKDFSGMTNSEMLALQMSFFRKEMDNAIRKHYKKIVFIHGVGNGVLKRALREELGNYPGVAFRDADYFKYGNGATEVSLV